MDLVQIDNAFIAAVSALAGIVVGQANGYFDRRSDKRKALSKALAELLEIRHRFIRSIYLMRKIGTEIDIPVEIIDEVFSNLPEGILWDKNISERYNEALNILSHYKPVEAFELRSKDIVGSLFGEKSIVFGSTSETRDFALSNIDAIERVVLPGIEDSLIKVAGVFGFKTRRDVEKIIRNENENISELDKYSMRLIEDLNLALKNIKA